MNHIHSCGPWSDRFSHQADVIEKSNKAYEARDRAQIETVQIQTAQAKARAEQERILEELDRKIEDDYDEGFEGMDEGMPRLRCPVTRCLEAATSLLRCNFRDVIWR